MLKRLKKIKRFKLFKVNKLKILKGIGYTLFAVVCLVLALAWTFPFDQLRGRIRDYCERQYKLKVDMESLKSAFPLGVKATKVVLNPLGDTPNPMYPIEIPYLKMSVGPLAALMGNIKANFSAEIFGGEASGSVTVKPTEKVYISKIDIEDLHFDKVPYFKNQFKELPVKGTFEMKGDVELHLDEPKNSKGELGMIVSGMEIGPGKYGMELPKVTPGKIDLKMDIKDGKINVVSYQQTSPDMQSDFIGNVALTKDFMSSRTNLDYRFKLTESLLKKNDIFKLALSAIKGAQGSDGYYYYSFRGTFSNPKPSPDKSGQYRFKDKGKAAKAGEKTKEPKKEASKSAESKPPERKEVKPGAPSSAPPVAPTASSPRPSSPPTPAPPPPREEPRNEPSDDTPSHSARERRHQVEEKAVEEETVEPEVTEEPEPPAEKEDHAAEDNGSASKNQDDSAQEDSGAGTAAEPEEEP